MKAIGVHSPGGPESLRYEDMPEPEPKPALRGMLVLFGQSSGAVKAFDPQVLNQKGSLFLTRPTLGHYVAHESSCSSAPALETIRFSTGRVA